MILAFQGWGNYIVVVDVYEGREINLGSIP